MGGVLGIAMAEVILDQAQVSAAVGEGKTAGVPQHVGMDVRQPGALGRRGDQVVDGLPGQWLTALRHEQPGQPIGAGGEIALEGLQFVTGDRVLDGEAVFGYL